MKYKVIDILKEAKITLRDGGFQMFALEAELLLASLISHNRREEIINMLDKEVNDELKTRFFELVQRRMNHEPISQILKEKEFWDYKFMVNSSVLTPRNDTETIIEQVLKFFPKPKEKLNILDLGTGSGCLGVTLAAIFINSKVDAVDISEAALKVAKQNAKANEVADRITFLKGDWFDIVPKKEYQIIVCNPPYISLKELKELSKEVKDFEPEVALTDFADGYKHYETIADEMKNYLALNGKAFFEMGIGQAAKIAGIFKAKGYYVDKIANDLAGIERCIIVSQLLK